MHLAETTYDIQLLIRHSEIARQRRCVWMLCGCHLLGDVFDSDCGQPSVVCCSLGSGCGSLGSGAADLAQEGLAAVHCLHPMHPSGLGLSADSARACHEQHGRPTSRSVHASSIDALVAGGKTKICFETAPLKGELALNASRASLP